MEMKNLSREEVIACIKLSIAFGADELVSETPRNRLNEQTEKIPLLLNRLEEQSKKDTSPLAQTQLPENLLDPAEKFLDGFKQAEQCTTISQLTAAINNFPHFIKVNDISNINFFEGSPNPFVIFFKEPEIYSRPSDDLPTLFNKLSLFKDIYDVLETTLTGKRKDVCSSVITFPLHFDSGEENRALNFKLIQPFLFQYISILKPKAIIQQGGPWLKNLVEEMPDRKELIRDILILEFPSLDVLGRAPKRKKEVWIKMLELKKFFSQEIN